MTIPEAFDNVRSTGIALLFHDVGLGNFRNFEYRQLITASLANCILIPS